MKLIGVRLSRVGIWPREYYEPVWFTSEAAAKDYICVARKNTSNIMKCLPEHERDNHNYKLEYCTIDPTDYKKLKAMCRDIL